MSNKKQGLPALVLPAEFRSQARYFEALKENIDVLTGRRNNKIAPLNLRKLAQALGTNCLRYSEAFDNAVWSNTGCTVTADNIAAPDGRMTADRIAYASNPAVLAQTTAKTAGIGDTVLASVYVKAGTVAKTTLNCYSSGGAENNSILTWAGGPTCTGSATITYVADGWWRWVMKFVADVNAVATFRLWPNERNTANAGYCYAWGAQLEIGRGSTVGPYVVTTDTARIETEQTPPTKAEYDALASQVNDVATALNAIIDRLDA